MKVHLHWMRHQSFSVVIVVKELHDEVIPLGRALLTCVFALYMGHLSSGGR